MIRKATANDIAPVAKIYSDIHTREEAGLTTIGWIRSIYPTEETAANSVANDELFVMEAGGKIVASARINQKQDSMYADGDWEYPADDSEVMVLHTLTVSPFETRKGYAREFVAFYESYAKEKGCPYLRMDTNERNTTARAMYKKLGYREIGIVPCEFNGIAGVNLVLLEKKI